MNDAPESAPAFDASGGEAAVIRYDVPLPTSHTGVRRLELDGVPKSAWLPETGTTVEEILRQNGLARRQSDGSYRVTDADAAFEYWREQAMAAGITAAQCDAARAAYESKRAQQPPSPPRNG